MSTLASALGPFFLMAAIYTILGLTVHRYTRRLRLLLVTLSIGVPLVVLLAWQFTY